MTVPVLFYLSERKKHAPPPVELPIPEPESPEETAVPPVVPLVSSVENAQVVESAAHDEPPTAKQPTGDERTEDKSDANLQDPGVD